MKNLSSSDFDVDGQPMRLNTQHQSSTRDSGKKSSLPSHSSRETQTPNKTESPAAPSQERPTKEEGSNTVKDGRGHGPRRHTDWKK